MQINKNLINDIKNLIKEKKAMIREIKKVHGSIHPAVSVEEKEVSQINASVNNYVMQINMFNQGQIFAAAKEFAQKEEIKLKAALGLSI